MKDKKMPKLINKNVVCLPILAASLMTGSVFAHDGQVNITGSITSVSCSVDTATQSVNIGDFASSSFPSVGSVTDTKNFNIVLSGCSDGILGTKILFSGTADTANTDLLALDSGTGTKATGVAVEIVDSSAGSATIPLNKEKSEIYTLTSGINTLTFGLRYKSTAATVTAGDANATLYFDMDYQ